MFSRRLSLPVLIELCRVLRHYLGAGLTLLDVFRQQAKKGGAAVRPAAGRIARALEDGDALEDALRHEAGLFPPLFLSLASVGERTGMLPEVFGELEKFYSRQKELRREFLGRIAWPVTQFGLAVLVLTGLIFVMGQIGGPGPNGKRFDPLGLGLFGASGAAIFFFGVVGALVAGYLAWRVVARAMGGGRAVLRMPVVGPCREALALNRFCLALRMTTESGMPIKRALRLSFRATGEPAFEASSPDAEAEVEEGHDLTMALSVTGLFSGEFLRIVEVAEEAGTLAEVLKHQGAHYHEEASRRLATATSVAGGAVWFLTGACIVVAIFRMYSSYLGLLSSF